MLDLAHGTQFTDSRVIGGDDLAVAQGSHMVVITAGAKQEPGQSRLERRTAFGDTLLGR